MHWSDSSAPKAAEASTGFEQLSTAGVDLLTDTLLSHLSYEERELVEPLARLGFYPGQL